MIYGVPGLIMTRMKADNTGMLKISVIIASIKWRYLGADYLARACAGGDASGW